VYDHWKISIDAAREFLRDEIEDRTEWIPPHGGTENLLIELQRLEQSREFNDILVESIDETITALPSREMVDALNVHLERVHSISKDEIPYRLESLFSTLKKTFGASSSRTICRAIARKFYTKLGLTFLDNPCLTLLEYLKEAKIKLGKGEGQL
jgi:hypothetical protein